MNARPFAFAGALAAAALAGALGFWWCVRCDGDCAVADGDAEGLFRRGEPLAALSLLDVVDARCRCSRFTSGDAPPQYALAQACLRRLLDEGREAEVEGLLARARGPILRELAAEVRRANERPR